MPTQSSTNRHRSAGFPSAARPVKPVPMPMATRSGASSTSEAIDAAASIGWRRLGIITPVPSPIVAVRSALRARAMNTSW